VRLRNEPAGEPAAVISMPGGLEGSAAVKIAVLVGGVGGAKFLLG